MKMIKRLILAAILITVYLTANAQIVTSQLNPSIEAKSPAATGWRNSSAISFSYGTAEGDVSQENDSGSMKKIGTVKYYGAAEGDGETQPLPALQGVVKNETFGLEIYLDNGKGIMKDVDMEFEALGATIATDADQADKDLRVYFSWMPMEELSVGLGYRKNLYTETLDVMGVLAGITALDTIEETEETETGIALVASYRFAEMFFVGLGLENMTKEGNFKRTTETDLLGDYPTQSKTDYVSNSWTNTYMGLGVTIGEPGDMLFRAEYSMISTPESDQDADGSKMRNYTRKKDEIYTTLEFMYGNFLISYENRVYDHQKISTGSSDDSNTDRLDLITLIGLGWVSEEGISITLISIDYQRVDEDETTKREFYPKGWGLYASYSF